MLLRLGERIGGGKFATLPSAGTGGTEYPRKRSGHCIEMTSFLDLLSMTPFLIRFKWSGAIHLFLTREILFQNSFEEESSKSFQIESNFLELNKKKGRKNLTWHGTADGPF